MVMGKLNGFEWFVAPCPKGEMHFISMTEGLSSELAPLVDKSYNLNSSAKTMLLFFKKKTLRLYASILAWFIFQSFNRQLTKYSSTQRDTKEKIIFLRKKLHFNNLWKKGNFYIFKRFSKSSTHCMADALR